MKTQIFALGRLWLLAAILFAQILPAFSEETYRERQDRLEREDQMRRDSEAALERWRERQSIQFAAIAYSKSTGQWGYGYQHGSVGDANREAIRQCKAPDAAVICWAKNGWYCAFADGPKSYAGASAATAAEAKEKALKEANSISPGARIILCIGGLPQKVERTADK